jgi:hypothetical protein
MSQALGMARGATGGLTRLGMALGAGRGIEQQAFDAESSNQSRMAQALAQARLAEAQARKIDEELAAAEAARARTERTAAQRPELLLDSIAGMTGTTRPTVDAVRQFKRTGRMPQVEMPGPPEEGEMAVMGDMQIDPAVQSRVARALGQLAPFMDGGDVDMGKWGQLLQTLQGNNLRDDMIGGQVDPGLVGRAQNAMAGRPEMQIPNNYMGNPFTGEVPQNPINSAAGQRAAPASVQEYEFAKGQGFKGSYEDWVMGRSRAGATNVSVNTGQKDADWGQPPTNYVWARDASGKVVTELDQATGSYRPRAIPIGGSKDDRERTDARTKAADSARLAHTTIQQMLSHPGLPAAVGIRGQFDPQNAIWGTPVQGARALIDQAQGQAFLQAFESLKGGGQITEIEGQKATQAMARLQRAQSESDFRAAAKELQDIADKAHQRATGRPIGGGPAPAGGGGLTPEEQAELEALRKQLGRR